MVLYSTQKERRMVQAHRRQYVDLLIQQQI